MKRRLKNHEFIMLLILHSIIFAISFPLAGRLLFSHWLEGVYVFVVSGIFFINLILTLINYFPDLLFEKDVKKTKKATIEQEVVTIDNELDLEGETVSLVGVEYNPYLDLAKTDRKSFKVVDETDDFALYDIDAFKFDLNVIPAGLIYASSGAGKSVFSFNLLRLLSQQYPSGRFVVADFGAYDWGDESEFTTVDDIFELFNMLRVVNRVRQIERQNPFRIIVLVEEFQAFLSNLKLQDKRDGTKRFEEFILIASQIAMTSRKTGACHLIGIMQNPKADIIPTELRENLSNLWGLRSSKNLAGRIMQAPPEVANVMPSLQPGFAYSHLLDAFFEYPLIERPKLPVLRKSDLVRTYRQYKREYRDELRDFIGSSESGKTEI